MGYQSDLTDIQWELIKDNFSVGHYGNRRKHPVRDMVNAIFYVIKSGCQWRMLPKDFPPFSAVFAYYSRCKTRGILEKLKDDLVQKDRLQQGRNASPTFGIIDSQSVKTTGSAKCRGIDGGKKNQRSKTSHSC